MRDRDPESVVGDTGFVNEESSLLPKQQADQLPLSSRRELGWRWRALLVVVLFTFLGVVAHQAKLFLQDQNSSDPYLTESMFFRNHHETYYDELPNISVAFIGNSMTFYNDLPRFVTALSDNHIVQNSCLHPSVSMTGILKTGSGMYDKFNTQNALNEDGVYDYGACTVRQLLLGYDEDLENQVFNNGEPVYVDDGTNPCLRDPEYLTYLNSHTFSKHEPHRWDYVVINDITRGPGRAWNRAAGMNILQDAYIPWFQDTGVTPIFFDTHGYLTDERDLKNVPTFTSLTYFGYKKYSTLVAQFLPESQSPRIAPVGIAFLTVW